MEILTIHFGLGEPSEWPFLTFSEQKVTLSFGHLLLHTVHKASVRKHVSNCHSKEGMCFIELAALRYSK